MIKAGLDFEMKGSEKNKSTSADHIIEFIKNDEINDALIDRVYENDLKVVFKANKIVERSKIDYSIQFDMCVEKVEVLINSFHIVASEVAENSIVLLYNEDLILLLPTTSSKPLKILYIDEFVKVSHNQRAISAHAKPLFEFNCFIAANYQRHLNFD